MFLRRRPKVWVGAKGEKEWHLYDVYTDPTGQRYIKRYKGTECWFLGPDGTVVGTPTWIWKAYEKEKV